MKKKIKIYRFVSLIYYLKRKFSISILAQLEVVQNHLFMTISPILRNSLHDSSKPTLAALISIGRYESTML